MSSTNTNEAVNGDVVRTVKLLKKAYKDCKQRCSDTNYSRVKWTPVEERHLGKVADLCLSKKISPEVFMQLAFKYHYRQSGPYVSELWGGDLVEKVIAETSRKHILTRKNIDGTTESIAVEPQEYMFAGQVTNVWLTISQYIGRTKDVVHEVLLDPGFHFHPVAVYIVGHDNEEVKQAVKQEAVNAIKNDPQLADTLQKLGYGTILGELQRE